MCPTIALENLNDVFPLYLELRSSCNTRLSCTFRLLAPNSLEVGGEISSER